MNTPGKLWPLLLAACPLISHSQTFTVLESFETFDSNTIIDSALPWNTDRNEALIYESSGDDDVLVTDGNKALEVYFFDGISGWGQDFQVALDEEASQTLLDAWNSTDPHRYWLFYDISFQSGGGNWSNNPFWIGPGATYGDQVEVNGNWEQPLGGYIELDAAKNGNELTLSEDNRVILGFGFNGDQSDASSVFVDNIRLLDTYAPGRGPSEIVLEGFENEDFDTLLPSGFEVFPYNRTDEADLSVTEGENSARVEVFDSGWTTTSTLDLTLSDELNDVLFELPQEERLNYILSFDYRIVPDVDVNVGWFQLITQGAGLRLTPEWGGGANRTYSINLGTVPWEDPIPVLNMITQGGFDGYVDVFLDNVRLINTQGSEATTSVPVPPLPPTPPVPPLPVPPAAAPQITDIAVTDGTVVLTFTSQANANYTVLSTTNIASAPSSWTEESNTVAGTGPSSTWETTSTEGARFYQIQRNE